MWGFHVLVWILANRTIKDTQCGFKLFDRRAAKICFLNLHLSRWAFDCELLFVAERFAPPLFFYSFFFVIYS